MHYKKNLQSFKELIKKLKTFSNVLRNENKNTINAISSYGIKGTLSGLTQFLATERPLKFMKNAFQVALEILFVLKMFKFLS